MKKRILSIILTASLLIGAIGITSYASFGSGVAVLAEQNELIKTGLRGKKLCFSDGDFKSAFVISDFESITVTALPSSAEGTLLLAGRRVREGQTIKRRNIAALVFVPCSGEVAESSFRFTVNGGSGIESICRIKLIDKINYAPSTEKEGDTATSLTTQAEISVFGRLYAKDPEGDELEFMIVSYPKNGTVSLLDDEDGRYKYTPADGFCGYDKFSYVARDEYGNFSDVTTVGVKTVERMSDEVFRDMTERNEYNAAVAMSALGVMGSTRIGDDLYFMPEEAVTRAEFVAMAMKAYGLCADGGNAVSFFDDNADIPTSLMGYVAKAQRMGIIDGELSDLGLSFFPNRPITKFEAAMIMAEIIGATSGEEEVYLDGEDIPIYARVGVGAMITLGIFDSEGATDYNASVTRAEAAEYLYRLISI